MPIAELRRPLRAWELYDLGDAAPRGSEERRRYYQLGAQAQRAAEARAELARRIQQERSRALRDIHKPKQEIASHV